jgi:murein DD-endopeptidase MepM/ murein hydrolase activator NlpD
MLLAGRVEASWARAAGSRTHPSTLRFPVARGWFVRGFGSGAGGYHQAMDIGGLVGWNVRAAAPGLVGYAGNEINGYGNIVMVIHAGGFITTYAHNDKNRVEAGQRVERGQVIAELGSTGRSKGPHVHFELLFNGQNCDPGPLFRPAVHRKNGNVVPIARSVWKHPKRRPKAVRCYPRKHHPDRDRKHEHDDSDDDSGANAQLVPGVTSP